MSSSIPDLKPPKFVYTPMHGVGMRIFDRVIYSLGFEGPIYPVHQQVASPIPPPRPHKLTPRHFPTQTSPLSNFPTRKRKEHWYQLWWGQRLMCVRIWRLRWRMRRILDLCWPMILTRIDFVLRSGHPWENGTFSLGMRWESYSLTMCSHNTNANLDSIYVPSIYETR